MPNFTYSALDVQGRPASGTLAADSRAAALVQISERGLVPVTIEAQDAAGAAPRSTATGKGTRVPAAHVETFIRELSNLLTSGVPLGRALHVLRRETSHAGARRQWAAIHDDVTGGMPLADAMGRWSGSFPPVYLAMVRAGEMGGFLDVVLGQIADFRAREADLKGKVKAAMIYPAVLASLAVFVMVFLLVFFIPRFSGIFDDFGARLPALTLAIVAVSRGTTRFGPLVALGLAGAVMLARRGLNTPGGRRWSERACLAIPAVGTIVARFALIRFSRMLGTLLGAGVPLIAALRVARQAIGNQILSDAVGQAIDQIKEGAALSRTLVTCPRLFPPSVIEIIAVAEETGRLDKELLRLAQTVEGDLDRRLRMLVALAEPVLLFIMAALIGTIVVGMLLPIFTLQELIR